MLRATYLPVHDIYKQFTGSDWCYHQNTFAKNPDFDLAIKVTLP